MSEVDPEDHKLITLARSARARTRAFEGAAVRDTDGRTYVAATVSLAALKLSALQLAIAMAVSSGALSLEAAVIVGEQPDDEAGTQALKELAPDASLIRADPTGSLTHQH